MVEEKIGGTPVEELQKQDGLTDEQQDNLASEAEAEIKADIKKKKDAGEELTVEEEQALVDAEEADVTKELEDSSKKDDTLLEDDKDPDKTAKETEADELKEKAKSLGLDENASKEDVDKAEQEKAGKDKKKTETFELADDKIDELAKKIAEDNKVSEEDAKADIKASINIINKHQNDPMKLAKAVREFQGLFAKAKDKADALAKLPPKKVYLKEDQVFIGGYVFDKNKVVEEFSDNNPDKVVDLDDSEILKLAAKTFEQALVKSKENEKARLTDNAADTRKSLILKISDKDSLFSDEVKSLLSDTPDSMVVNDFQVQELVEYVKGTHYWADIKKAREEGIKQGKEESVILGEKNEGTPKGGSGKVKAGTYKLTAEEKSDALNHFEGVAISDEEKYKSYHEILQHEKNVDKKRKTSA